VVSSARELLLVLRRTSLSSQQPSLRARVLRSGSAGNAILIEAGATRVLLDAGLPAEVLLRELQIDGAGPALDAILQTHEHDDHTKGAAALARATGAVVWANEPTIRASGECLASAPLEVFRTGRAFRIGALEVLPFPLPHDAAEPVGFVLAWNGLRIAAACDLGEVTDTLIEHARGADLFIIEANYDLRLMAVSGYPWFLKNRILSTQGHLSNDGAAQAAAAVATGRPQTVWLVHLSEVNNLAPLARDTVREALDVAAVPNAQIDVIRPNAGGPWWTAAPASGIAAPIGS
jgi:phosphoribosyl 1,2-cyclic phosphodiesterase